MISWPGPRRMAKRGTYGVYFIFKSMEQGATFRVTVPKYPTKDPNYRILAHQRSRFTHYYFYIRDVISQQRNCHPEDLIEPAGDEAQDARRQARDDRPLDAVEIGPIRFPVLGVFGNPNQLVRPEFDEFERAGADRMRAHVARRDVTGVDRRPAGG